MRYFWFHATAALITGRCCCHPYHDRFNYKISDITGPETPPRILTLLLNPGLWAKIKGNHTHIPKFATIFTSVVFKKAAVLEIIFPWVNIAPFGFPGRKNKADEATVVSRKTEKPHRVMWSPVVPEVKQTSARSSGAGGCNQIRREKMNRVATGNDKTLNFGTPKILSWFQNGQRWGDSAGSSANSPLVQHGCLFPEPVKVKNQWDRVCRSTFACQSQYNRLKTKKALSTPQTPWSWSLQRRTPAHASRGPFRTLQWSRSSSPASLYRWRTRGSSRLFPARRRSLWRWSLQQNRPR